MKCMIFFAKLDLKKNVMFWGWEKNTERETKTNKTKEKMPRLVALPSPLLRYGGRLFFDVQERRKQAGSTLTGRRI